jgi:hypothetical protein
MTQAIVGLLPFQRHLVKVEASLPHDGLSSGTPTCSARADTLRAIF